MSSGGNNHINRGRQKGALCESKKKPCVITVVLPVIISIALIAWNTVSDAPVAFNGHWGSQSVGWHGKAANHEFCGENYRYARVIAELHNTWSSAPLVFFGSVGTWYRRLHASCEKRYACAFVSLGSIGVGSMLFHGTLLRWGQVMDEAPMMLLLFSHLFMFIGAEKETRFGAWLPFSLILACVIFIGAYLLFYIYWFFLVGFTGSAVALLLYGSRHALRAATILTQVLFLTGVAFLAEGFACWQIDTLLCEQVQCFRLHILWHFGARM